MSASVEYDIQCGTDEATGEKGTWIVRKDGERWLKIAKFTGEQEASDENVLGAAAEVADALWSFVTHVETGDDDETFYKAASADGSKALKAAGWLP